MLGLHHVLACPRQLTPERAALVAVAALTAVATPPIVASIPDAANEMGGSLAAMIAVVATTTALATALGHCALRAGSGRGARTWLVFGGAGAGVLATLLSFAAVRMVGPGFFTPFPASILIGSLVGGPPLGFVLGTAFTPVILAAVRARRRPSHDGVDRVVFAAGAMMLAFGALRRLLPSSLPGAAIGDVATVAGGLAMAIAGARLVVRVRLLSRAREGGEPGFHVIPRSGREDEAPLLPLVRTSAPPTGVLAATGASAPYRGARGIFKLALVPLPDELFEHPVADLIRAAATEGAHAVLTLAIGATAVMMFAPILVIFVVSGW